MENHASTATTEKLLEIRNLSVSFRMYGKGPEQADLQVISDLNVTVRAGELHAVAGASGSGKSVLAGAVLGVLPKNARAAGDLKFRGEALTESRLKALRGKHIAYIPQSVDYLDPLMKCGAQVDGTAGARARREEVFRRFRLKEETANMFPFQLSGGMMRRVLIATASVTDASLIIADEPTPGLGKPVEDKVMRHLRDLADEGRGVLLITHDIDLAVRYADRVSVFYAGTTVENADAKDFTRDGTALRHPYTKALWNALPQNGFAAAKGMQPYAGSLPEGCLFAPRCEMKTPECTCARITMRTLRGGEVACIHAT